MADRHTLAISQLSGFKAWLTGCGWNHQPLKGPYEIIRARKDGRVIIAYRKEGMKEHVSVADKDIDLVREYIRTRKRERMGR